MKKIILILLIVLLTGCTNKYIGTYYTKNNDIELELTLKEDNTCIYKVGIFEIIEDCKYKKIPFSKSIKLTYKTYKEEYNIECYLNEKLVCNNEFKFDKK